ncbi:protein transport protein Sec61 subunit beta-like protein [Leptotrombidium deliense]|uniref:Protein transport protein Sec61 subunit beta-like protein n=1 Tax=Leptotrombidium deliense TaxID=299467 RepID=A0A443SK51_9ACAR|nr:protein transport protein Sec61 subunit beta-like protein [Leptotrombidium deliense]
MAISASSTSVGSGGGRSPRAAPSRSGGTAATVKQRKSGASGGSSTARSSRGGPTSGGMWRFYTDDSPGIKVGPVPVLVMSLVFIASVFMLHIWGKYTRS